MSKRDVLAEVVRIGSVMGTVREDVTKAIMKAEVHPSLAEVLLKLHDTQFNLDKALQELQRGQLEQAKLLDRIASTLGFAMVSVEEIAKQSGIKMERLFGPEVDEND